MATYKIVYDTVEKRPGCVLLQAGLGGNVPGFEQLFQVESWLLAPTPGMKVLPITDELLPRLVEITEKARNGRY